MLRAYGAVGQDESSLVIGLLLPDAPVVTWWPGLAPTNVSHSSLGQIAQCRITDARGFSDPLSQLNSLSATYAPGDADFAWTRVTLWRAQLAAILDQPPHEPITAVTVVASANSPSATLLAAWLSLQLSLDVTLTLKHDDRSDGSIRAVTLSRFSGDVTFKRVNDNVVRLTQAGQPTHDVTLPNRSLRDCLSEELRRLDPDVVYGEVITQGLMLVRKAIA
ncbi:unannotated protein [freshwater metagenome]|uniref:Unannotated protein n=1 Tax=freshwater metagenome TaxID=449393 RepID=A0A6J7GBE2_9ZZZZ